MFEIDTVRAYYRWWSIVRTLLEGGLTIMLSRSDLERLINVQDNSILSIYIHTDPSQKTKDSYRIWLKDALRDLQGTLDRSQQKLFQKVAEPLTTRVQEAPFPGKSWIAFANSQVAEEFHPQVPVENEVHWGRPQVTQLHWLLEEYHPYGAILADSEHLRIFIIAMNEILEIDDHVLEVDKTEWRKKDLMPASQPRGAVTHGSVRGGNQRDDFADRERVQTLRFWKDSAPILGHLKKTYQVKQWVVGGPKVVRDLFAQYVGSQNGEITGEITTPFSASPSDVLAASLHVIQERERQSEEMLVSNLMDRVSRLDRASAGLAATLQALQEGRVEVVIVARRLETDIYECSDCGRVFAAHLEERVSSCPTCSSRGVRSRSLRVMLPSLLRRFGAKIELVKGSAARKLESRGGIGALWRY